MGASAEETADLFIRQLHLSGKTAENFHFSFDRKYSAGWKNLRHFPPSSPPPLRTTRVSTHLIVFKLNSFIFFFKEAAWRHVMTSLQSFGVKFRRNKFFYKKKKKSNDRLLFCLIPPVTKRVRNGNSSREEGKWSPFCPLPVFLLFFSHFLKQKKKKKKEKMPLALESINFREFSI